VDLYCRSYPLIRRILHIIDTFTQEGVVTIAFGLLAWHFVPTSPRAIKILTEEEREAYCRDLADDWSGDADTMANIRRKSVGMKSPAHLQMRPTF